MNCRSSEDELCTRVEDMIVQAHCETVRELEALYDGYRKNRLELDALEDAHEEQEGKAQAAQRHVAGLLESYRERFCDVGEDLRSGVGCRRGRHGVRRRGISRTATRNGACRRIASWSSVMNRMRRRSSPSWRSSANARVELGLEVRHKMRDHGYADERLQDNVLTALRSYRIRRAPIAREAPWSGGASRRRGPSSWGGAGGVAGIGGAAFAFTWRRLVCRLRKPGTNGQPGRRSMSSCGARWML